MMLPKATISMMAAVVMPVFSSTSGSDLMSKER